MPPLRSNHAPHYSGSVYNSVDNFLKEYEEFADNSRLTNTQKVELIICYTTLKLWDFWRSLDGYVGNDWKNLKWELRKIYTDTTALR